MVVSRLGGGRSDRVYCIPGGLQAFFQMVNQKPDVIRFPNRKQLIFVIGAISPVRLKFHFQRNSIFQRAIKFFVKIIRTGAFKGTRNVQRNLKVVGF